MSDSLVKIDGLTIDSNPVFATDCSFPITDFANCCERDDVIDNLPIHIGHWPRNTKAPAISKREIKVKAPVASKDDCLPGFPVVSVDLESCELIAPNMVDVGAKTGDLKYTDLLDEFCYRRRVLPNQICVFDQNGNLNPGSPIDNAFILDAMSVVFQATAREISRVALVGDDANTNYFFQPNEFNGFYTQLKGGWDTGATACPATYNTCTTIDWQDLTGSAGNAKPDDRTVAGKKVTIFGTTYNVPVGLNLPDFLDTLWIDKIEQTLDCVGGVTAWEMHAPLGFRACYLRAEACMKPCSTCFDMIDDRIRRLYQASISNKFATLLTGRSFPILESRHVADNELWFGPRTVGGRPTYGLFFDSMDRYFGRQPQLLNSQEAGYGNAGQTVSPNTLAKIPSTELEQKIESIATYWNLHRKGICINGFQMMRVGMLTCSRNSWVRFTNVQCPTFIEACESPIVFVP